MKQYFVKSIENQWFKGSWDEVVTQSYEHSRNGNEPFVIQCDTLQRINAPWHLSQQQVLDSEQIQPTAKRGRPKLGVRSKEVTLLPKHWEWLSIQQGGASGAIRKLIDQAMLVSPESDLMLIKQQKLDQFLYQCVGDQPGFEQCSRAIYQLKYDEFVDAIESWEPTLKSFILQKFAELES
ncbi:DUF2239 family protein [Marinicellulosiphila megalodicopiae]|uniref:DUF2239 family protein n=1 Tax=Marinicellulosiphila megalodicopiae TaxID=2724896 RepID=UPI003BAE57A1